jgi:copper chaperone CopZ
MVVVLLGLVLMDEAWSGPVIAVALVVCLLLMIALGGVRHVTESASAPTPSSLRHVVHRTAGSENRRGDTEAIRAMLRNRQIVLDEQDRPIHVQFQVRGLTCAGEAAGLAHKLRERDGVIDATVNPLTERAYIDYTDRLVDAAALTAVITSAGYEVELERAPCPGKPLV